MANSYINFSFTVPVADAPAAVAEYTQLCEEWDQTFGDDGVDLRRPDATPHPIYGELDAVSVLTLIAEDNEVWISDQGTGEGDVEQAAVVTRWLLDKPGSPDEVFIEWANTCSKPRVGEFSGGACLVTRNGTAWLGYDDIMTILRGKLS